MKSKLKIFGIVGLILFVYSTVAQGEFLDGVKEYIRPYIEKSLGQAVSSRILGELPLPKTVPKIVLPPIPTIRRDAKATYGLGKRTRPGRPKIPGKQSKKLDYLFINELHNVVFTYRAALGDLSKWLNVLEQGGTREGVYRAFILSNTYKGLEDSRWIVDGRGIDFTIKYMKRFLALAVSKSSLQKYGFFTMKSRVVELTLEVMDELYRTNEDYLCRWYAVFSADMARDFSGLWAKNKMRRVTSRERHMSWSKVAPKQHIKSEVIIKLHQVFNQFQR